MGASGTDTGEGERREKCEGNEHYAHTKKIRKNKNKNKK
jgi:hypothetical protein